MPVYTVSMKQIKYNSKSEAQNITIHANTCIQTTTPLRNRLRDDGVVQQPPLPQKTFLQLIHITDPRKKTEQQLSYRKQIARKLRTKYVEGIYGNHVTLQSRKRVTQGHWKRNHWVDHTRLTISRFI